MHTPTNLLNIRNLSGVFALATAIALSPLAVAADVVVTESAGTVSSFSPDSLVIQSEVATAPTRYVLSRDVTYVDETGAPVSMEVVRSGAPVTVHYAREGERVVARRVVVRRSAPATVVTRPAAVVEERVVTPGATVVTPAPRVVTPAPAVIEERRTTTTTTTTKEKD